jgi:hypothetical protein
MDERGVITVPGPFEGLDRFEARPAVVAALREQGRITDETRPYVHAVGHCSRCGTIVEPRLSLQWFVKVEPLAKAAGDAVRDGREGSLMNCSMSSAMSRGWVPKEGPNRVLKRTSPERVVSLNLTADPLCLALALCPARTTALSALTTSGTDSALRMSQPRKRRSRVTSTRGFSPAF